MDSVNEPNLDQKISTSKRRQNSNGRSCHIVLQGKGGVGKSLVASLIAQFIKEDGRPLVAFDTDPVQNTLTAISALQAIPVALLDSQNRVNVTEMDAMVSRIIGEDAEFVVDAGAASFMPLSTYLLRDRLIDLLTQHKRIVLHTLVVGGRDLRETALAAKALIDHFPQHVPIVVWLNPHFGDVLHDGRTFEESAFYTENRGRIAGIVHLPALDPHFSGATFARMVNAGLTFAEARASDAFDIVTRFRLANIWEPLKTQIAEVV